MTRSGVGRSLRTASRQAYASPTDVRNLGTPGIQPATARPAVRIDRPVLRAGLRALVVAGFAGAAWLLSANAAQAADAPATDRTTAPSAVDALPILGTGGAPRHDAGPAPLVRPLMDAASPAHQSVLGTATAMIAAAGAPKISATSVVLPRGPVRRTAHLCAGRPAGAPGATAHRATTVDPLRTVDPALPAGAARDLTAPPGGAPDGETPAGGTPNDGALAGITDTVFRVAGTASGVAGEMTRFVPLTAVTGGQAARGMPGSALTGGPATLLAPVVRTVSAIATSLDGVPDPVVAWWRTADGPGARLPAWPVAGNDRLPSGDAGAWTVAGVPDGTGRMEQEQAVTAAPVNGDRVVTAAAQGRDGGPGYGPAGGPGNAIRETTGTATRHHTRVAGLPATPNSTGDVPFRPATLPSRGWDGSSTTSTTGSVSPSEGGARGIAQWVGGARATSGRLAAVADVEVSRMDTGAPTVSPD